MKLNSPRLARSHLYPLRGRLRSLPSAIGLTLAAVLHGQSTPATAPTAADAASKEEALTLSPFEVHSEKDAGYTATSALSGGRTDTPLKYTPAAISVMTSQFLEDINATNFRSADEWAVNYVPAPEINTNGFGGVSINYRNMGSTFATRNYFIWYVETDSYNVERLEFARGPNGVLFGDGGASGVATTFTKRPHFGNVSHVVGSQLNTDGGYRVTADLNQPLNSRFALRLNALRQRGQFEYRDHTHWDRDGVHLAGIVKLTDRSNARFEVESGHWNKSIYPNYINDQGSLWNGTASYNGVTAIANAAAVGVQTIPAAAGNIYANGTLANWTNFYRSIGVGSNVNLLPTGEGRIELLHAPRLPHKGFNFEPTDAVGTMNYYTYTGYVDHRFSDNLYVELAYNRERQTRRANAASGFNFFNLYQIDVNTALPGGVVNPNYGKSYTDSQPQRLLQENMVDDVRLLGNWRARTHWLKESASFISGTRMDRFHSFTANFQRLSDKANILVRRYWDQEGTPEGDIALSGVDYVRALENWQRKSIDYAQLATTSQFFDDRLTLLFGTRYDKFYNGQLNALTNVKSITRVSTWSKNAGAVYFVFPWLGAFANYSETFQAPNSGDPLLSGAPAGISRGKGEDYGLKFEFLGGRISGNARYYRTGQVNRLQAGNNVTEINAIWNALNQPSKLINSFRDTNDLDGTGYEVELTGNPTPDLRLTFNVAFPKVTVVNVEPQLRSYVAANVATWQAAAVTNPAVQTNLATITNRLDGLVMGALNDSTFKYTANFLAAYNFRQGWLKNVSVGTGANIRGKQKFGSVPGQPFNYLYTDGYALVSAFANYRYRFTKKVKARFQVNVSNLLNNDQPIGGGYANITTAANLAAGAGPLLLNQVRIPDPRKATFTASFEF